MVMVALVLALLRAERLQIPTRHNVVEDRAHPADCKTEDQALNIEAGSLREIEQAGRVPISWHKERLGQSERHR